MQNLQLGNLSTLVSAITQAIAELFAKQNKPKKTTYYNARVTTEGAASITNPKYLAQFSVQFPQPFINKMENYDLSIIRFSSSLHGLPALFVAHPVQAGPSPTNTHYVFSLSYDGATVSETVQWSPADASLVQGTADYSDEYWYEYSFIRMGTFINAALTNAMNALIALKPALAGVPAPFFQYDTRACIFTLYTPVEFLDTAATPVQIFQNEPCHFLLGGLPVAPTGVIGRDSRILIIQQPAEQTVTLNGHDFVTREQIPGSLTSWSPVRRFVLTTTALDVAAENTYAVTAFTSAGYSGNTILNSTQRIISDYTPNISRGDQLLNGSFEYTPQAQYRITNISGCGAIGALDVLENWEDPLGGLHPVYLRYGGYCSYKFAFLEK